eukprot:jgi/Orpsp1_1/1186560/evm.model.d7180000051467.1
MTKKMYFKSLFLFSLLIGLTFSSPTKKCNNYYTLKKKDNLFQTIFKNKLSIQEFKFLNNVKNLKNVKPGDEVCISGEVHYEDIVNQN